MLGYQEIIIILVIALLVFGPQKLPEIGRQVGSAMRELRKMSGDVQRALDLDEHLSPHGRYDDYHSDDNSFSYSAPSQGETYSQESPYGAPAALESASSTDVDAHAADETVADHTHSVSTAPGRPDPLHGVVEHENGEPQPVTAASTTAATAAAATEEH